MTIQYINTGTSANKGDGDSLRTAFNKINQNFAYISSSSNTGTFNTSNLEIIDQTIYGTEDNRNISILPDGTGTVVIPTIKTSHLTINTGTEDTVALIGLVEYGELIDYSFVFGTFISTGTYGIPYSIPAPYGVSTLGGNVDVINSIQVGDILTSVDTKSYPVVGRGTSTYYNYVVVDLSAYQLAPAPERFSEVHITRPMSRTFTKLTANSGTGIIIDVGNAELQIRGSIIPSVSGDETHLGLPDRRWEEIWVGKGSVHLLDETYNRDLKISAKNGNFTVGNSGIEVGNLIIYDDHISATTSTKFLVGTNTQILSISTSGIQLSVNRSITFGDGTIQTTAYTGTQVLQGPIGPQGPAGPQGPIGSTGTQGIQGIQGPAGPQGPVGPEGPQGPVGSTGTQGIQGPAGPQGPKGDTGAQGLVGSTGTQGIQGPAGPQGSIGPEGPQGPIGSTGTQGPQGVQGPIGPQGISVSLVGTVTDALSLPPSADFGQGYITVDTGNVWFWGTNTQWNNVGQIVGPQGIQGVQGPKGDTGDQGPIGSTGTQGIQGPEGPQGPAGPQGIQGPIGSTGTQGIQGPEGPQGPKGDTGDQGPIGSTGTQGPQGIPGPDLYTPETPTDWIGSPTVTTFSQGLDELAGRTITLEGSKDRITTGSYSVVLGADGVLTLPSGNTRIGDVYGAGNDVIAGSTGTAVGVLTQGTSGYAALQWIGDTTTSTTNAAAVIVNSPFSASSGTVQIATGAVNGPVTDNIWEFGANGILTLPNGLTIDGSGTVGNSIQIGGTSTWISVDNEGAPPGFMVATDVGGADHRWLFDPDGTLTAPGHLMPNADLAYDLGSTATQWRSIYVGTGTIFIGGVALGVNQDNFVTVDGNPIITVNTSGNMTIQGDTNIVLGSVVISDTAPEASTPGSQWFNTIEARTYVAYNQQWVDASPTVLTPPDTNPTLESVTFNNNTVQTTAWSGTYSYNDLTDKPVAPTFVGGGGASTWLTAN